MSNNRNPLKERLYNIWKWFKYPEKTICNICEYKNYKYAPLFSDRFFLKCFYKKHMGKKLNLSHPVAFSEKLQWLKLYDRKPEYSIMADKVLVKDYIREKIGAQYVVPTIGVYNSVNQVPFDCLPDQYVIKCSHDSGSTFICSNKESFNIEKVKEELSKRMKSNYYWVEREWPYKKIIPRIIVEEYLCDDNGHYPPDYKFFCFDGEMHYYKVDYDRFSNHRANYYNRNHVFQPFGELYMLPDEAIKATIPDDFNLMIEIAEILSVGIPFVRIDFYNIHGRIYVGEMTFFPSGGVEPFVGNGDIILGELIKLPEQKIRG